MNAIQEFRQNARRGKATRYLPGVFAAEFEAQLRGARAPARCATRIRALENRLGVSCPQCERRASVKLFADGDIERLLALAATHSHEEVLAAVEDRFDDAAQECPQCGAWLDIPFVRAKP